MSGVDAVMSRGRIVCRSGPCRPGPHRRSAGTSFSSHSSLQLAQIVGRGQVDAAFSLNRLQHHRADVCRPWPFPQRCQVVERHITETLPAADRSPFDLFLAGGGEGGHGPPVKRISMVTIRCRPAPYSSLEYLRASLMAASLASAPLLQKNTRSANECSVSSLGQFDLGLGVIQIGDVHESSACSADRLVTASVGNGPGCTPRCRPRKSRYSFPLSSYSLRALAPYRVRSYRAVGLHDDLFSAMISCHVHHLTPSYSSTISVPMPLVGENFQQHARCRVRPSMICALLTPLSRPSGSSRTLGIIPPVMAPVRSWLGPDPATDRAIRFARRPARPRRRSAYELSGLQGCGHFARPPGPR